MSFQVLKVAALVTAFLAPAYGGYIQVNLVSDLGGVAPVTDPSLVNPWGLSASATSPWWVSDNGTGLSTVYSGAGAKAPITVTVPTASGGTPPSTPTGQIFNATTDFKVNGANSNFIFATEDGTISARTTGTTVTRVVDNSGSGAVYKGLASGNNGSANYLYAANFSAGTIDVFNATFGAATLPGGFTDSALPAGYAPFNIQNLGGNLFVTYAKQDPTKKNELDGAGLGLVDEFDTNGNLIQRLVSNGGVLDAPWGVALAPSNFGLFSNDLLVGNFGNGMINAFNPGTGTFLGALQDGSGNPIAIPGLWGIGFGNGTGSGATNSLYFAAGIPGSGSVEDHGLFGALVSTPEPSTWWLVAVGAGLLWLSKKSGRAGSVCFAFFGLRDLADAGIARND